MKNLIRFAVAGALAFGVQAANAQALPSSGSSDLWLFVSDPSAGTTFAEDTGIAVNSLLPSTSMAAGSVLASVSASINLNPTTALTNYINAANAAGQTLEWGVDAAQYATNSTGAILHQNAQGAIVVIADNTQSANTSQMTQANLATYAQGFNGDITYLKPTYAANGASYAWSAGTTAGQVWGATTGNNAGSTDMYGQGPNQAGIGLGSAATLFGLTPGGSGVSLAESYVLGTLTLSNTGVLSTAGGGGGPPPVPVPAAFWLFGSGLLGLAGVGRRRNATV